MQQKNIEAIYSLSPSQQGMLFESLAAVEPGVHIEQSVWRIGGTLHLAAFERAWQRVVERHTVLRTVFVWKSLNEPLQVVLRWVDVSVALHDWQGLSPSE